MVLLGSTGSIGQNTLDIARRYSLHVTALCANSNTEFLNKQIKEFNPKFVAIADKSKVKEINHPNVYAGDEGVLEMIEAAYEKNEILVNALVGFAGLAPTLKANALGYKIALANKESLVTAGEFLNIPNIIPIDSEHFGLWYLLGQREPKRLLLTASGGAFRDTPPEKLAFATLKNALKHPNWKMGKKITIDSATMVNKLFEVLEAYWLFSCKEIDAFIETKSIIHALVEFVDGSTTAHLANADMRLPIAFALLNKIDKPIAPNVNLLHVRNLEFKDIDVSRYPVWQLRKILLEKSHLGVVLNAANDEATKLFLEEKIAFNDISKCIMSAMEKFEHVKANSVDEVFLINLEVKSFCSKFLNDRLHVREKQ
ncbi:MAG: 1-deoxy-D-xylulose-5-phosphate reductoisomerase [Campylobacteraceae bacterium]|jgi:1-deoxy-D-xylulose-5-phosphate reductoisomerase|nr:1-deoxy-D-xylulose-5-phosphate reductoisomerase [Campylobacteraceae bacterium]